MHSQSRLWSHFHTINDDSHEPLACNEQEFDSPETFFDLPSDSFWLPERYEQDWLGSNAVMERQGSMKFSFTGDSNGHHPKSFSSCLSRSLNQKMTNPSFIGTLKAQKSCLRDRNFQRNKEDNARLFRSRSEPVGKTVLEVTEPSSPRVSCMGRVDPEKQKAKRIGVWKSFKSIIRNRFGAKPVVNKGSTGFA